MCITFHKAVKCTSIDELIEKLIKDTCIVECKSYRERYEAMILLRDAGVQLSLRSKDFINCYEHDLGLYGFCESFCFVDGIGLTGVVCSPFRPKISFSDIEHLIEESQFDVCSRDELKNLFID